MFSLLSGTFTGFLLSDIPLTSHCINQMILFLTPEHLTLLPEPSLLRPLLYILACPAAALQEGADQTPECRGLVLSTFQPGIAFAPSRKPGPDCFPSFPLPVACTRQLGISHFPVIATYIYAWSSDQICWLIDDRDSPVSFLSFNALEKASHTEIQMITLYSRAWQLSEYFEPCPLKSVCVQWKVPGPRMAGTFEHRVPGISLECIK